MLKQFVLIYRRISTSSNKKFVEILSKETKGINLTNINEAIEYAPELCYFAPYQWQKSHDFLVQQGFRSENFLSMITNEPNLLKKSEKVIFDSLNSWRSMHFGEKNIIVLLEKYPKLIQYNDFTKLSQKIDFFTEFIEKRKNIFSIFMNSPNLFYDKISIIDPKMKYLKQKMKINIDEIDKSSVFSYPLEKIQVRHAFLERLGSYKPRNPKADPTVPSKNPKLSQIMDTSDKRFAVKIAFVTLEEFEVFQDLYKAEQERTLEQEIWSDDD